MLFTLYNTSSPNLVQKRYCECLFVFSCYEKYSSIWNCACIITIHIKALKRDKYLWLKGHSGTQAPNRRSHSEVVYRLFAQHFQLTLICVDAFFLLHLWKKRTEISSCLLTTHLSKWIVDNVFAALYAKRKKKIKHTNLIIRRICTSYIYCSVVGLCYSFRFSVFILRYRDLSSENECACVCICELL